MLLESELGDTTTPVSTGLLAQALAAERGNPRLTAQLLEFNIVCLAQGTVRDTYRSLSLIVSYRDGGTDSTTQLHLQCDSGSWSIFTGGVSRLAASTPNGGTLSTALKTDCIACLNPLQGAPVTQAHHCQGKQPQHLERNCNRQAGDSCKI